MLHQIGAGVLGPVFRTYQPDRDRLVAVKVFQLDLTPEQGRALADELQRIAKLDLSHPSIVAPIAAGVEGVTAYLANEYVAAESLDVALRHYAPAPVDKALPFVTQLAGAIDSARAAGVRHGSLHPRDVFLTPDEARATGFGVADALEHVGWRAPVRRPYSAPERVAGNEWGSQADVFSLAAIAFELLTGRRISGTGEHLGAFAKDLRGDVDPRAVGEVFRVALAEAPAGRYSTALAFAAALESALRGQPARVISAEPLPAQQAETEVGQPQGLGAKRRRGVSSVRKGAATEREPDPTHLDKHDWRIRSQPETDPISELEIRAAPQSQSRAARTTGPDSQIADFLDAIPMAAPAVIGDTLGEMIPETRPPDAAEPFDSMVPEHVHGHPEPVGGHPEPVDGPVAELADRDLAGSDPFVGGELARPAEGAAAQSPFDTLGLRSEVRKRSPQIAAQPEATAGRVTPPLRIRRRSLNVSGPLFEPGRAEIKAPAPEPSTAIEIEPPADRSDLLSPAAVDRSDIAPTADELLASGASASALEQDARLLEGRPAAASLGDELTADRIEPEPVVPELREGHSPRPRIVDVLLERSRRAPPDRFRASPAVPPVDDALQIPAEPARRSLLPLALMLALGLALGFMGGYRWGSRGTSASARGVARAVPASDEKAWSENAVADARSSQATLRQAPATATPTRRASTAIGGAPRPTATAPSAAAKPARGRLLIRSQPAGSRVSVNGRQRGITPLSVAELPFGSYAVQIGQAGYRSEERRLVVSSDRPIATLSVQLRPIAAAARPQSAASRPAQPVGAAPAGVPVQPASVYIESRPLGARVFMDGKWIGSTPLMLSNIAPGAHTVRLERDGYQHWSGSVSIAAGERRKITASLDPKSNP